MYRLANLSPRLAVVTQNIDSLHQATAERWDVERQLIEVHGRLGLYHCASDEGACHLSTETYATADQLFPPHVSRAIEQARPNLIRWRDDECATLTLIGLFFTPDSSMRTGRRTARCRWRRSTCRAARSAGRCACPWRSCLTR